MKRRHFLQSLLALPAAAIPYSLRAPALAREGAPNILREERISAAQALGRWPSLVDIKPALISEGHPVSILPGRVTYLNREQWRRFNQSGLS